MASGHVYRANRPNTWLRLATAKPELFDKYLYMGTTRAAMYLGLTTEGRALPDQIASLKGLFGQSWS